VTGRNAIYKDVSLEEYFASGIFPNPDGKAGHSADPNDTTLQTYRQIFTGFWNMFWATGRNAGNVLDEIYPRRIRTVGE